MSENIKVFLVCDKCENIFGENFGFEIKGCMTKSKVRKEAKRNGWKSKYIKFRGTLDYCNECVNTGVLNCRTRRK